jgi:hypothetical protein
VKVNQICQCLCNQSALLQSVSVSACAHVISVVQKNVLDSAILVVQANWSISVLLAVKLVSNSHHVIFCKSFVAAISISKSNVSSHAGVPIAELNQSHATNFVLKYQLVVSATLILVFSSVHAAAANVARLVLLVVELHKYISLEATHVKSI